MRLRRLCLAAMASTVTLFAACAAPEKNTETAQDEAARAPRDCEPQTGTRVPASCTKRGGVGSSSSSVQTMGKPTRIESN